MSTKMNFNANTIDTSASGDHTVNAIYNPTVINSDFNGIVMGATDMSKLWDGGFVGINSDNAPEIEAAINSYCEKVQEQINSFNADAKLDTAMKGQMKEGAIEFVNSVKAILNSYVSTMRGSIAELRSAVETMQTSDSEMLSTIASTADEIRSAASSIKID